MGGELASAGVLSATAATGPISRPEGDALDPIVQPQCSLAVQLRRANGAVTSRPSPNALIWLRI